MGRLLYIGETWEQDMEVHYKTDITVEADRIATMALYY